MDNNLLGILYYRKLRTKGRNALLENSDSAAEILLDVGYLVPQGLFDGVNAYVHFYVKCLESEIVVNTILIEIVSHPQESRTRLLLQGLDFVQGEPCVETSVY